MHANADQPGQMENDEAGTQARRRRALAILLVVLPLAILVRDRVVSHSWPDPYEPAAVNEWFVGIVSSSRQQPEPGPPLYFFQGLDEAGGVVHFVCCVLALPALIAAVLVAIPTLRRPRRGTHRLGLSGFLTFFGTTLFAAAVSTNMVANDARPVPDWATLALAGTAAAAALVARRGGRREATGTGHVMAAGGDRTPIAEGPRAATEGVERSPGSGLAPERSPAAEGPLDRTRASTPVLPKARLAVAGALGAGLLALLLGAPLLAANDPQRPTRRTETYGLWSWTGDELRDPRLMPSYADSLREVRGEGEIPRGILGAGLERLYATKRAALEAQQRRGRISAGLLAFAAVATLAGAIRLARRKRWALLASAVAAVALVAALLVLRGSTVGMVSEFGSHGQILGLSWPATLCLILAVANIILAAAPLVVRKLRDGLLVRVTVERRR